MHKQISNQFCLTNVQTQNHSPVTTQIFRICSNQTVRKLNKRRHRIRKTQIHFIKGLKQNRKIRLNLLIATKSDKTCLKNTTWDQIQVKSMNLWRFKEHKIKRNVSVKTYWVPKQSQLEKTIYGKPQEEKIKVEWARRISMSKSKR